MSLMRGIIGRRTLGISEQGRTEQGIDNPATGAVREKWCCEASLDRGIGYSSTLEHWAPVTAHTCCGVWLSSAHSPINWCRPELDQIKRGIATHCQ
ncbi:hypothetical protein AAFF_G00115310 [Aldrovandia affinis]|uniref:Uncharacterized protein n=1 Tax=Aldrovandia affinis TaxID=143900 RepID=A0AAD7WAQ3_9TELE|nr:hypothetical protein AAFF_G00115310 [Aldrovandia affinis]